MDPVTPAPKPAFDWRDLLQKAATAAVFAVVAVLAAKLGIPLPQPAVAPSVQVTAYPGATVNAAPAADTAK